MYSAALDSSANTASFVVIDIERGDRIISDHSIAVGRDSARLLVTILGLLKHEGLGLSDITEWTVGVGPGSFTGIRVGIALIKGICAGTGSRCRGIPSSLTMALQVNPREDENIMVLHDGRRNELITTAYLRENGKVTQKSDPVLFPIDGLDDSTVSRFIVLDDNPVLPKLDYCRESLDILTHIDAGFLLESSGSVWPEGPDAVEESLDPVYVRPAVFTSPRKVLV